MAHWIQTAEAALDGRSRPGDDAEVEVAERYAPAILDAAGIRASLAPLLAGFVWSAAVLRETQTHAPLDPLALLLRLLALALTVRAVALLTSLAKRLRVRLALSRYGLAIAADGLLLRTPSGDVVVPRSQVVDVRERGQWRQRAGRRWAEVYVVTRPQSGRLFLALPPIFERTPGVLAERLMRWLGPREAPENPTYPEPAELASKLWDSVAAGARPDGVAVIPQGSAWLQRGPYASLLLGLALLDGFVRLPANARAALSHGAPAWLWLGMLALPAIWILLTRRDLARRKGVAMLLTAAELLVRTRAGIHRLRWPEVKSLGIETRTAWSILQGAYESRTLVVKHQDGEQNRLDEAFIGVPAEVVVALGEAHRKGLLTNAGSEPN
jgi:hypothetical protein